METKPREIDKIEEKRALGWRILGIYVTGELATGLKDGRA
jgi:hypothetical protein